MTHFTSVASSFVGLTDFFPNCSAQQMPTFEQYLPTYILIGRYVFVCRTSDVTPVILRLRISALKVIYFARNVHMK